MSKQLTFSATICALTMALFVISADLGASAGQVASHTAFSLTSIGG